MKVAAVIAEFHPFHNGHAYLCHTLRESGYTHVVAIMSGNFVQRGECAVLEKMVRTRAALLCGVDLVLELPLPYALATAEIFACGGVASLSALGCVDTLAFGSESGNAASLSACAQLLLSPEFGKALSKHLALGMSFASARQKAVADLAGLETASLLSQPNNILGIEYCKQLLSQNSKMRPVSPLRAGAEHDSKHPSGSFASASYLRGFLSQGEVSALVGFVPEKAFSLYQQALKNGLMPISQEAAELLTLGQLRRMSTEELARLPDISEGLEYRIEQAVRAATTLDGLYSLVKTKRYSHARIRRIVLSALAGLTREDGKIPPPYLRVLGMNGKGKEILAAARKTCALPLSTSLAKLRESSPQAARFARLEATADDLYNLCLPLRRQCGTDYTENAVIL